MNAEAFSSSARFNHFARIDRNVVNRAERLFFIGDKDVFAVKEQNAEMFGFPVRHGGMTIVQHSVPTGDDVGLHHSRAGQTVRSGLDDFQFLNHSTSNTLNLGQSFVGGRQNAVEVAEFLQKTPRQRFHVAARHRAKQHQL